MPDLQDKVKDIIVEELGVERENSPRGASSWRSRAEAGYRRLVMALQKEFNIDIHEDGRSSYVGEP